MLIDLLHYFMDLLKHLKEWLEGMETLVTTIAGFVIILGFIVGEKLGLWPHALSAWRRYKARRKHLRRIVVGYDVFPDSMPLLVGDRLGMFRMNDVYIVPKRRNWNGIFEALETGVVDIIFANRTECEKLTNNDHARRYHYFGNLVSYYGFAIMVKQESLLQPFRPFPFETRDERLKRTIRQLRDRTVYATENTDHYDNLIDCLSWARAAGSQSSRVSANIVSDLSPWKGLRAFLSGDKEAAYVGGVSQRLVAERYGAVSLVNQEDLATAELTSGRPLPLREHNGFIVREERREELTDVVKDLTAVWQQIVRRIDEKDRRYVRCFMRQLNRSSRWERLRVRLSVLRGHGQRNFKLTDFKTFWNRWIFMHTEVLTSDTSGVQVTAPDALKPEPN